MWIVAGVGWRRGAGKKKGRGRDVMTSSIKAEGGSLRAACLPLLVGMMFATFGDGAAALDVLLRAPNYVFVGESAVLKCEHGVSTTHLHKVEWLKDGDHKLFQFVRGRNPPFRNFTIPGATLDWIGSNENEIRLTGLSLKASGIYSCEVSMETPIYTKPSNDERLVVIQRQAEDPIVSGMKESYFAGEKVAVNCTSSPSHPPVQIAWLVNGREVSDQLLTRFPEGPVRQYELATHGAHHIRPFRTSSDDHFDDSYESHELLPGGNALGTKDSLSEKGGKKNDFLASAALGKLLHGSSTTPASPRGGRGGPTVTAPTRAAVSSSAPRGRDSAVTTASGATVAAWTQQEDGEYDPNPMDAFDPPEVVPIVTATASSTTVQLSFVLTDEVVRYLKKDSEDSGTNDLDPTVPKVRLILTCSAIIPETVDGKYADQRLTTVAADVILSEETTARFSSATHSLHTPPGPWLLFLPFLASLLLLVATTPQPARLPLHQHKATLTSLCRSTTNGTALPHLSVLPHDVYSVNHVRPRR